MSYRTHCDWCGDWLEHYADRAEMRVTVKRRLGTAGAPWQEEVKVTRHFCVKVEREDVDRWGRDRMGLVPSSEDAESCSDRAIQAICGNEVSDPGMGLQWRLVAVPGRGQEEPVGTPDEKFRRVLDRLTPAARDILPRAGIASLDDVAEKTDEELLAIPRVGPGTLKILRAALADREEVA